MLSIIVNVLCKRSIFWGSMSCLSSEKSYILFKGNLENIWNPELAQEHKHTHIIVKRVQSDVGQVAGACPAGIF